MKIHNHPQGSPSWWQARRGKPTGSRFGDIGFGDPIIGKQEQMIIESAERSEQKAVPFVKLDRTNAKGFYLEGTKKNFAKLDEAGNPPKLPPDWRQVQEMKNTLRFASKLTDGLNTGIKRELSDGAKTYAAELIAEGVGWQRDEFAGSPDIERGHELEDKARQFLAFEIGEEISEVGFCVSDCGRYGASPDGITKGGIPIELKAPDWHTQARYLIDDGGIPTKYLPQVHGHMIVTGAPYAYFCAYTASPKLRRILVKVERDAYTEQLQRDVEEFCARLEEMRETCLEKA